MESLSSTCNKCWKFTALDQPPFHLLATQLESKTTIAMPAGSAETCMHALFLHLSQVEDNDSMT